MSRIRPAELDERMQSGGELFLLDIRPSSSYRTNSIENSYNVPVYDDLRRGDEAALRDRLEELPTGSEIVVICKMGIVAKRATSVLTAEGYDATTLAGGMSGWMGYQSGSLGYKLRSLLWKIK